MRKEDVRSYNFFPILKEAASDLLRDCDTSVEAQRLGKKLVKAFEYAVTDVATEIWYREGR